MMRRLSYFLGKALGSVRESPGLSFLTAATIGATLLIAGLYLMALQNLEGLALIWGRTATLTAYVQDGLPTAAPEELRAALAAQAGVERAVLISPSEALERFRARGPAAAALVEGVAPEILPPAIELHLRGGFADLGQVEALARAVRVVPGVADVDYGQTEFERLRALLELLRLGGLFAGLLLALATAFIIANTIRLTVFARREEIIILRLVGATAWFVRLPFLIEGLAWGLSGGLAAAALLWAADLGVAPRISVAIADVVGGLDVRLFAPLVALGLIGAGALLGVVGSALAVRRFLDEDTL